MMICVYVFIDLCMFLRTGYAHTCDICTCIYIHTYTHAHIHTYTYIWQVTNDDDEDVSGMEGVMQVCMFVYEWNVCVLVEWKV